MREIWITIFSYVGGILVLLFAIWISIKIMKKRFQRKEKMREIIANHAEKYTQLERENARVQLVRMETTDCIMGCCGSCV